MCIGVCCKNFTFFDNIVCLFRHSHITSYSPAFQVISVISPPGLPGKRQTAGIGKRAYEPSSSLSLVQQAIFIQPFL